MPARILNGIAIRDQIYAELKQEIAALGAAGIRPGLAAVLVGENPASQIYVRSKIAACEQLGLGSWLHTPSAAVTTEEMLALVAELNARDDVDGILVQLPLPPQVDTKRVLEAVDPAKDVDGFHPVNLGRLVSGRAGLVACTPAGCMEILRRSGIPLEGAERRRRGAQRHCGKADGAAADACQRHGDDLPLEDARSAGSGAARRYRGRGDRPRGDGRAGLGASRRDGDRCGHQSHHRCRRSAAHLREFSREARAISRERLRAGRRRSSGRRGSGRGDHAGAGRRGAAHHRHADEQHGEGGAPAARARGTADTKRHAPAPRRPNPDAARRPDRRNRHRKKHGGRDASRTRLPRARSRQDRASNDRARRRRLRRSGARIWPRHPHAGWAAWIGRSSAPSCLPIRRASRA